ncbi:MAG: hydrogenase maturation protease [Gemmatimonadota bacterium]
MDPSPTLVAGLGNPLAGDDAVGWHVADRLARGPERLPDTEVVQAGTDLLRLADRLRGRRRVFLVDALLDEGPCGRVVVFHDLDDLDDHAGSVHHLSPAHALQMLRSVYPEIRDVPVTFLCVTIHDVCIQHGLSPELQARMDHVVTEVLARIDPALPR